MYPTQLRGPCPWRVALVGILLLGAPGCAVTRKIAVAQMVPILQQASEAARETADLHYVESAFPANLVLLDGLIRTDPKNHELLTLGAFLNFGYALGFVELDDPTLAVTYYEKGLEYGLRALERNKKFKEGRDGTVEEFQASLGTLGRRDAPAMAWTVANWGRWISFRLESPAAIAQQPRFEALLARLLVVDPEFEQGLPHVVRGAYDALRPEMFGGRPDSSLVHFEHAFRLSQRQYLLYLVLYAEHYCRQILDEDCFATTLAEVMAAPPTQLPELRLLNQIARRRAERLLARQEDLF